MCVEPGHKKNEDLNNCTSEYFTTTCGLPYEYESVMHYRSRGYVFNAICPQMMTVYSDLQSTRLDQS